MKSKVTESKTTAQDDINTINATIRELQVRRNELAGNLTREKRAVLCHRLADVYSMLRVLGHRRCAEDLRELVADAGIVTIDPPMPWNSDEPF